MRHYRKTKQSYAKFNSKDKQLTGCTFCNEVNGPRIISENDTMFIMPNRVSYDMFEGQPVADHLMVIPKRHVETVSQFTDQEKLDQMSIVGDYEVRGYDVYARGVGNITRSVAHQHTHLIKLIDKKPNIVLFTRKPYFLFNR